MKRGASKHLSHTYPARHYRPGLAVEGPARPAARARASIRKLGYEGKQVRSLRSMIIPRDESFSQVVEAASKKLVRGAYPKCQPHCNDGERRETGRLGEVGMHRRTQSRNHRRRGRLIAAGAACVALLAAACSGTATSGSSAGAPAASSVHAQAAAPAAAPAQALKPLRQPGARCGAPKTKATLVRFHASDGTGLDGVLIGSGTTGVVLAHEYASDLCNFWPFARYLAKHGLRAFAIDMRCFGRSACPAGAAKGRVVDDIVAAAAELRHRGVTKVALVGASMGGSAALIAATRVQPPVDAVVELSGEANPTQLLGIPLNARAAVGQLTVPTMFVVANLDQYTSVPETRALYQAAKTSDKRLVVLSGQSEGLHGTGLLTSLSGGFSPVATTVADFITTHTQS